MGEVGECSIRLYGMLAGLGVCHLLADGCRWYGLFQEQLNLDLMSSKNITIACKQESGCGSELSP